MLTADAVWAVESDPGSRTRACREEAAIVAPAASTTEVLDVLLKNANACSLTRSRAAMFAFEEAYNEDKDPATLATSRF
jgi:hypothetical protein